MQWFCSCDLAPLGLISLHKLLWRVPACMLISGKQCLTATKINSFFCLKVINIIRIILVWKKCAELFIIMNWVPCVSYFKTLWRIFFLLLPNKVGLTSVYCFLCLGSYTLFPCLMLDGTDLSNQQDHSWKQCSLIVLFNRWIAAVVYFSTE